MSAREPTNPYEAPAAALADVRTGAKRFRWQVVPAALSGYLGVLALFQSLRGVGIHLDLFFVPGLPVALWWVSTILWLRSRWWVAAVVTAIAYILTPVVQS